MRAGRIIALAALAVLLMTALSHAAQQALPESHSDRIAPILISLTLIALGAAMGGRAMSKVGQPAVLGELLIGVLAGNVAYLFHEPVITVLREGETLAKVMETALTQSVTAGEALRRLLPDSEHTRRLAEILGTASGLAALTVFQFIDLLSRLAAIILLFLVGLETSVAEMRKVGRASFLVAVVGVVCPFLLGLGATMLLMPGEPLRKATFIGAIFTATSVGITARVFRDLRQSHRTEAKIILGAAVIDDVLGLIILAVVSGLVVTGSISFLGVSAITVKAVVFLAASIGIGVWFAPRFVKRVARLGVENVKLLFGLGFAFVLSWVAIQVGLAAIVGAFAAGLVLEEFFLNEIKGHTLRETLAPVESLIVPVFFVLMGLQVKLETLGDWKVVLLAAVLTFTAIVGKIVSGLASGRGADRLSVGIGMMPRGEVGLIFAGIGKALGVVTDAVFSAVVIMVMITTLLTPPLLKVALARSEKRAAASP